MKKVWFVLVLCMMIVVSKGYSQNQYSASDSWKQIHYSLKTIDTHCDLPMKMTWYDMGEEHDYG